MNEFVHIKKYNTYSPAIIIILPLLTVIHLLILPTHFSVESNYLPTTKIPTERCVCSDFSKKSVEIIHEK